MVRFEPLTSPEPLFPKPKSGGEGRLVVVSNRVPVPSASGSPAAGGLAVALNAALQQRGGFWFGWSGKVSEEETPLEVHDFGHVSYAVTDLSQRDIDEYYAGFANRALWPVCHYRLDLTEISANDTAGYFRVNEFFARRLATLLKPDDVIWVHDYHFIPLAAYLRQMGFENRIGFFLHIPWAPYDVSSALPAYQTVLSGMTRYDVIGFQTRRDLENFTRCLEQENMAREVGGGCWEADGRTFRVGAFPIGIETDLFRQEAREAKSNSLVRRMRASMEDRHLIIGVDRLDYSKGIRQRIAAFSCMLERFPQMRNRVTFLQITPKSRSEVPEYIRMQHEVAEQAGWTNGKFGDVDWTPVRYINKAVSRTSLAGLYRTARVGMVTPLRDGMNLVAKEYVASQRGTDPGVLVLSRFAGAAAELDSALLVNPYDTEATANAIVRALEMSLEERKERWRAMMDKLRANTVDHWCASFLSVLAQERACLSSDAAERQDDGALEPAIGRTAAHFGGSWTGYRRN
ncbi:alpha,alpha-trehalose-phosphate synthase (UDP-forming) [Alsobacter soli]|uniref:Trehalose-6-phosphate synthase n=2 Tax=Alsobacter soli TaxID=2109933 RepID=A0A2T1HX65_9HYPH|nr:alpha,alpha-trehalose-phosphate synthase (UDP-forming) [Alsobacter soli]